MKISKGFPFGIELDGSFGHLANTGIVAGGGDLRIALFEGFGTGIPRYFPDVGVAGGVRTMAGSSELRITVVGVDTQLSKPIPIAGSVVLEPHIGYQWLYIFGDAGLVDLPPNTDALGQCGYQGDNSPSTPDPRKPGLYDGQPVCTGSSADFNNAVVFDRVSLHRHRFHFGTSIRWQMVHFGIHVLTDLVAPPDANSEMEEIVDPDDPTRKMTINKLDDDPRTPGDDAVKRQWTIGLELGAAF